LNCRIPAMRSEGIASIVAPSRRLVDKVNYLMAAVNEIHGIYCPGTASTG
jgi:hypothetical protein